MASIALPTGPAPRDIGAVPSRPIDFSVPYRPREKGAARHFGFFPFFAKKPWQVVQAYIKHYTMPGDVVGDPFSGSGVTPVEALVLGRWAVASDINPVARFITRMTAVAPVDLDELRGAFERVRAMAQTAIEDLDSWSEPETLAFLELLDYPRDPIPPGVRRAGLNSVDALHTPRQLAGLTILRDAIKQISEPLSRDLLRVALANTVRYANKMYILPVNSEGKPRSPYRGDVGFLRRFSYSPASPERFHELRVWPTFERAFAQVLAAKEETNRLIGTQYRDHFVLRDVPASRFHEMVGEGRLDYCFTDPPYSNEIRFLDLSTLWAAWLEMTIDDDARRAELLIDPPRGKTRDQFEREFAASAESISRALKDERWFTLVYKHRDLSLWQTIVAACEDSGLRYINSVWQDVRIPSTRQNESPNINPKGDMYLNFRKMSQRQFTAIYGPAPVLELPTRANYIEHEVERVIVGYLGADIALIASTVIQQILDSAALRAQQEKPEDIQKDLQRVLDGSRFTTWKVPNGPTLRVMAPGVALDSSLDIRDRARYHVFASLREKGEAAEGEITHEVLTRLAEERDLEPLQTSILDLLRTVGEPIGSHRWRFDAHKVADYKQLRLFFWPTRAEALRERIEQRYRQQQERSLRPDLEGLALLRDRLREANTTNSDFETQWSRLQAMLQTALLRLMERFRDQIECVQAAGDWAAEGIDLRNLPFEDVVLDIVLRGSERSFELYWQLADEVFADLRDDNVTVQFRLLILPEWERALALARSQERTEVLGIPLLSRA